jgi:hypothetical protein
LRSCGLHDILAAQVCICRSAFTEGLLFGEHIATSEKSREFLRAAPFSNSLSFS